MHPTWKVKLFEANPNRDTLPRATLIDTFGVEADGHDDAKEKAQLWLEKKNYKVRGVSFTTDPFQMIAYVAAKGAP